MIFDVDTEKFLFYNFKFYFNVSTTGKIIKAEFTNERINGIKGRNSKNRNSKPKYVDTTNEISNIFVSRLFARDRIKQIKIRSIQSNDKG